LKNVWWERVGEDAATFRGQQPDDVMLVDRGGASGAKTGVPKQRRPYDDREKLLRRELWQAVPLLRQLQQAGPAHIVLENITAVPGKKSHAWSVSTKTTAIGPFSRGVSHICRGRKPKLANLSAASSAMRVAGAEQDTSGPDPDCIYDEHSVIIE